MSNPTTPPAVTPITFQQALKTIQDDYPEEAKTLQAHVKADVVALGTDEAFALRNADGEIKAFKQRVHLSLNDGTLVQPVYNGPCVVSAQGYEVWAESAGASVIFPKEVLVGQQWQQNPYVERDRHNNRILFIMARAIAFRYSSKGIPQVCDWSTIFDTPSYRLIDLLGKAKKCPQAFKLYPADMGKPEEKGTWASYPFDEATVLWINTAHEEALTWFAQILNREKKAIDFAQTFARRNALKHLSGLQKAPGPQWDISVLCWRPTGTNIIKWDASEYARLQDRVGAMIAGNTDEFKDAPQIEAKTGKEAVSDEQGFAAIESGTDPEDLIDIGQEPLSEQEVSPKILESSQEEVLDLEADPPKMAEIKLSKENQKVMKNFELAKNTFDEEFQTACAELGIDSKEAHTPEGATAIMAKMNEIMV